MYMNTCVRVLRLNVWMHVYTYCMHTCTTQIESTQDRFLLQIIVSFVGLFCKRDLKFKHTGLLNETIDQDIGWLRLVGSFKL